MRGCTTGRHSAWHSRALEKEQHSDRSGGLEAQNLCQVNR